MRHHQPARPSDRTGRRELAELGEEDAAHVAFEAFSAANNVPGHGTPRGRTPGRVRPRAAGQPKGVPNNSPDPRGREREKENDGDEASDQENQSPDNDRDDRRARLGRAGSRRDGTRDLANGRREIGAPRRWWLPAETEGKMRLHVPRVAGLYGGTETDPLYRQ